MIQINGKISHALKTRINILKMATLPKATYRFKAIPMKLPKTSFTELEKIILNFIWTIKDPELPRHSWEKRTKQGLPWCLSGKESACQCSRHGFNPLSGKTPHAMEQLSPCTPTTECVCALKPRSYNYWAQVPQPEPMLHKTRSHHHKSTHHNYRVASALH